MRQPHTETAGPVGAHPTADNDARQRDRVFLLCVKRKQSGPVLSGVFAGQVADCHPADPDRNGVSVVRVVALRDQDGLNFLANPIGGPAADDPPEFILVVTLPDDLQVVTAAVQNDLKRWGTSRIEGALRSGRFCVRRSDWPSAK